MNFSPCLDIFFKNLPFTKRLETVSSLGYKYYEFWTWWDKNLDEIVEVSQRLKIQPVAYCTRFISLVDKSCREQYIDGLGETIEHVNKTKTRVIISQVGDDVPEASRDEQLGNLIDGLKASARLLKGTDIILAVEPLNTRYDHNGYFLSSSTETVEVLKAVNSPNVKMLFDIYHQQIMEGDLINSIRNHIDYVAHFHAADVPGRHELGSGEINFPNVIKAIRQTAFRGCVGIELFPLNPDHKEVLRDPLFL
jgi:hydroxypyruvate isomerase